MFKIKIIYCICLKTVMFGAFGLSLEVMCFFPKVGYDGYDFFVC